MTILIIITTINYHQKYNYDYIDNNKIINFSHINIPLQQGRPTIMDP